MSEIACTLPEDRLAARRSELRSGLLARVRATRELPDGIELRFDPAPGIGEELDAFVAFERGCCGFASFEVEIEDDAARLRITGPEGTKEFVRRMLGGAVPSPPRRWLRLGAGSAAAAVFAWICCTAPVLAILAGLFGVEAGLLGVGLDAAAAALALCAVVFVGLALWRRTRGAGFTPTRPVRTGPGASSPRRRPAP